MNFGIGIDTGGTFTDSVIVDLDSNTVISAAKALTTKQDLKIGIANSLDGLDQGLFDKVKLVSLSTTLATNSIVEGKGSRVGVIIAVPNPKTFNLSATIPAEEVVVIAGAHNKNGEVTADLDVTSAKAAIERMISSVDSFAVSSYFSIYNAEHELAMKEIAKALADCPVVCGHELSGDIGMLERAVTAALNAKLLPIIKELLDAVRDILAQRGIDAPVMVVKGDGSVISEQVARDVPVETVLSGPAASVVGACHLSGLDNAIIVDMGGTTTDIAIVENGVVATRKEGAIAGGWQTRVHAVDMWTIGLGGDSNIEVVSKDNIKIGPRKAVPLSLAAQGYPRVKETLKELAGIKGKRIKELDINFFMLVKRPNFELSKYEQKLIDALDGAVLHRREIAEIVGPFVAVERFVELGFVAEVSFTPTDLLHARGELELWDAEAPALALWCYSNKEGINQEALSDLIYSEIIELLKLNIAAKALFEDESVSKFWNDGSYKFLKYLLSLNGDSSLSAAMSLRKPLVAVGAPVEAYFPKVAGELGADLVIPENAHVANAVGAVTGKVIERAEVFIRPDKITGFLVVTADEHKRFSVIEDAVVFAEDYVRSLAARRVARGGGTSIETTVARDENVAPLASGWGDAVLIELKVTATAIGKPQL